ncbi:MAG: hypothetical protein JO009_03920 [Candidatus Eremiobacteraeota bacterium]|nr:hypothetical protein [Candidatus Eremiobacteraeota bacterium]
MAELQKNRTKIIIPTPSLAELLVRAGKALPTYLAQIKSSSAFRIAPFDDRGAVQVALMAQAPGDRPKSATETYAKIKYDRQIVAIAKVEGATVVYSDDSNVRTYARNLGMRAVALAELPLPEPTIEDAQMPLPFGQEASDATSASAPTATVSTNNVQNEDIAPIRAGSEGTGTPRGRGGTRPSAKTDSEGRDNSETSTKETEQTEELTEEAVMQLFAIDAKQAAEGGGERASAET